MILILRLITEEYREMPEVCMNNFELPDSSEEVCRGEQKYHLRMLCEFLAKLPADVNSLSYRADVVFFPATSQTEEDIN